MNNEVYTYDPLSSVSMRTSTLPSSLTRPNPSLSPKRPPRDVPVEELPITFTDNIFPSAGWLWNFCTAEAADAAVLNVILIRGSSPFFDMALWSVICPQRLKMAATSSAVVPLTSPETSITLPCDPLAPFIESDPTFSWRPVVDVVASLIALWAMVLRPAFGAAGLRFKRAESELWDS